MGRVLCEVGTELLNSCRLKFVLQRVNYRMRWVAVDVEGLVLYP
jgi:hypothetical protein